MNTTIVHTTLPPVINSEWLVKGPLGALRDYLGELRADIAQLTHAIRTLGRVRSHDIGS